MSDLLRKKTKTNKLLNRGPKITPTTTFSLQDEPSINKTKPALQEPLAVKEDEALLPARKGQVQKKAVSTTVRVSSSVKEKLNALVTMGISTSVDSLLEILIEEYESAYLTKEEKKQYSLILDIYASKNKK